MRHSFQSTPRPNCSATVHPWLVACLAAATFGTCATVSPAQSPVQSITQTIPPSNPSPQLEITPSKIKLPNHRFSFRYEPSQRDPFISSLIITPTVSKQPPEETPAPSVDLDRIKQSIVNLIESKVKITGLTYGKLGRNFAVTDSGQILTSGKLLALKTDDRTELVDAAIQHTLQFRTNQRGELLIKVIDIQNRQLILLKPWERDQPPIPDSAIIRVSIKTDDLTPGAEQAPEATADSTK
jgi:hypothetical protein